jgi:hypothetical protein
MKCFKDNQNRNWTIVVNVATVKRVRSLLDINLLDVVKLDNNNKPNVDLLEQLASDPVLLCDVIYCICKPEADAQNISDEDFGMAMGGDAIEHATTALLEELVDFFPEAKRLVLRKLMNAGEKVKHQMEKALKLELELDNPQLDKELEKQVTQYITSSTSSPELSE